MRIVSWNVNGLRAVWSRKDLDWALDAPANGGVDVIGLQETKLVADQLTDDMRAPRGFRAFWTFGKKKGYSGTALWVREGIDVQPLAFSVGGDANPEFDTEGRVAAVEIAHPGGKLAVICCYFPNGGSGGERLAFKHAWHDALLQRVTALKQTHCVVLMGDFNVAHRPIDVAFPERWGTESGFLPEERAWFDRLLAAGFVDTFRADKGDLPKQYTFWETRVDARRVNQGWRIDYIVVSDDLGEKVNDAFIQSGVMGSDHCPVGIELGLGAAAAHTDLGVSPVQDEVDDDDGGFRR